MKINKEDIIDAGIEYTLANNPVCLGGAAFADAMREFNRNRSFEAGAEWVLSKLKQVDEEKLEELAEEYSIDEWGYTEKITMNHFKAGYRKAMEV